MAKERAERRGQLLRDRAVGFGDAQRRSVGSEHALLRRYPTPYTHEGILSHNSDHKPAVEEVARRLRDEGIDRRLQGVLSVFF